MSMPVIVPSQPLSRRFGPTSDDGSVHRLERPEVHTSGPELCGVLEGTGCALEYVLAPCDLEPFESRGHDRGVEFCLEQSPRDSVGPEIDVPLRSFGDRPLHCDVRDLELSAWS